MSRRLPLGSVAMRLHLHGDAEEEICNLIAAPWPRTIRRLYDVASLGDEEVAPSEGEVPVSAAIAAVDTELHHRLSLLSWVASKLEELRWTLVLDGSDALAIKVTAPVAAIVELEDAGVLGPLLKVCDTSEETGMPRFYSRWDRPPRRRAG